MVLLLQLIANSHTYLQRLTLSHLSALRAHVLSNASQRRPTASVTSHGMAALWPHTKAFVRSLTSQPCTGFVGFSNAIPIRSYSYLQFCCWRACFCAHCFGLQARRCRWLFMGARLCIYHIQVYVCLCVYVGVCAFANATRIWWK